MPISLKKGSGAPRMHEAALAQVGGKENREGQRCGVSLALMPVGGGERDAESVRGSTSVHKSSLGRCRTNAQEPRVVHSIHRHLCTLGVVSPVAAASGASLARVRTTPRRAQVRIDGGVSGLYTSPLAVPGLVLAVGWYRC